jgi:hypothetical protein
MPFDLHLVEARLALNRIGTTDFPKLAWDALEANFDGPATRRLAALDFPTIFEVNKVLPGAMREWGIAPITRAQAALRLAQRRTREILQSGTDPLKYTSEFYRLWRDSDYSRELADYGILDEDAYVAHISGQTYEEIRAWILEKLLALTIY